MTEKNTIEIVKIGDRKFVRVGEMSIEIGEFKITSTEDNATMLEVKINLYGRSLFIETSAIEE